MSVRILIYIAFVFCINCFPKFIFAQQIHNKKEQLEWFSELGYGLFIHWGIDDQIGTVISHSLVDASRDYCNKYFNELPDTFNPNKFDPEAWARLARIVGVKYVVFTAKHHSGFCMFDTQTTDFNVMNTPYKEDITGQVIRAFRKQGIAIGLYYSPDDFHFLYEHRIPISRNNKKAMPLHNSALLEYDKQQLQELLTNYGKIDILFLDGIGSNPAQGLASFAWEINPDLVITRGAMKTPEISPSTSENLPKSVLSHVWEACFTMGTSWQYKPTNEHYRNGTDLIKNLVKVSAQNGNMLLNIGPKPNGYLAQEQKDILREIGTWLFINGEAIYSTQPWIVTHEGNIWFTSAKNRKVVYAILTDLDWQWGTQKTIFLNSVRASDNSTIQVLGQNSKLLEYHPEILPDVHWENTNSGLEITVWRTQRIYNNRRWPNPVVIKITNPLPNKN